MRITLTGATGFIGKRVSYRLRANRHQLAILSRHAIKVPMSWIWNPSAEDVPQEAIAGSDAIVHLAGEPITHRWTEDVKARIMNSRVGGTRRLVEAMLAGHPRPEVFVCASAIGYYGDRGEEILDENSGPGEGFLSEVCVETEKMADLAAARGIRVVKLRFGVVLGRGGGALARMLPPFLGGLGGKLAGGQQWMSWIHIQDAADLIVWVLSNRDIRGAVNATSPNPVTNADFTKILAKILRRPAVFQIPRFALRLLYGEMAEVLLGSQRVIPGVALKGEFGYKYGDLEAALRDVAEA